MDAVSDTSRRILIELSRNQTLPDYVQNANLLEKEAADQLDDRLFADEARRSYPLHDAGNTWLSAAYFAHDHTEVPEKVAGYVEQRIRTAAQVHGISPDVDALLSVTKQAMVDPEADDANYGVIVKDGAGNVVRRLYPLVDDQAVRLAMAKFGRDRGLYPMGIRRQIAAQIEKHAAAFGVPATAVVLREAGHGYPVRETLMFEILERAHLTKDAEAAQVLANINEVVAAADADELLPMLDKLAEVIDTIDRLNGLNKHYGRKLLPPADFLFSLSEKEAADLLTDSLPLSRHVFSLQKLATLDPEVFAVLGDDLPKELAPDGKVSLEKLSAILPTLPQTDKELLERHLIGLFAQ